MGPPPPPGEEKIVVMKCVGGEIGSASALAPKLGPLGLSPKKVGEDIQKATMEWKGIKVMVRLSVINRVVSLFSYWMSLFSRSFQPFMCRQHQPLCPPRLL